MMSFFRKSIILPALWTGITATAQNAAAQPDSATGARKWQYWSIAITNNHTAYPFASFAKLATGEWHPGVEAGTGFNWSQKKKHDWFQELRAGYFYHQFVQHGILLYTSGGYRYRFSGRFHMQAGLGLGLQVSVPDQQRFKLNEEGNYERLRSPGRLQGMVAANITAAYRIRPEARHPIELFATYQQRLQTPYVPSYVPLLPYNTLMLGIRRYR